MLLMKKVNFVACRKQWLQHWSRLTLVDDEPLLPRKVKEIIGSFFDMTFAGQESMTYFENLVNRVLDLKREDAQKRNDFLSMCINNMVDIKNVDKDSVKVSDGKTWTTQGLTKEEVIGNAVIFLIAGYESTGATLQNLFYLLAWYPEIQEKLYTLTSEISDEDGNVIMKSFKVGVLRVLYSRDTETVSSITKVHQEHAYVFQRQCIATNTMVNFLLL
ncbi:hypothetical protein EB796_019911 [Bugula neritina]|uniref:CYP3A4 n=1 Tax=Bugula neritina TaxID=10212 RepID=A0A7J7J8U2_BUGNE|nr:hypothetical protein EB796_019911 [Bugula neritina]